MLECPFCHYTWQQRVDEPKQCPRCKRYFNEVEPVEAIPLEPGPCDQCKRLKEVRIQTSDGKKLCIECAITLARRNKL